MKEGQNRKYSTGTTASAVRQGQPFFTKNPVQQKAAPFFQPKATSDQVAQRQAMEEDEPIQAKANNTGLPDNLKAGVENLSGYSMDDVKVHYNSAKPAQLNAHAYAQGTDIHLAPGQEKHLPHEAWHVVQQKQGRVRATRQMKGRVAINDDVGLEREADVMGEEAFRLTDFKSSAPVLKTLQQEIGSMVQGNSLVQRIIRKGGQKK